MRKTYNIHNAAQSGFTLIELSIVLIIIGLIIGGVLVGRDLIKAAEIRSQLTQISKINQAVLTFRLKYNCLPADCKNATQFFGAASQPEKVTNGDGNGVILGYRYAINNTGFEVHQDGAWNGFVGREFSSVFDQLSAAGFWDAAQYDETNTTSNAVGIGYPKLVIRSAGETLPALFPSTNTSEQGGVIVGYEPAYSYIPAGHKLRFGVCMDADPAHIKLHCLINSWEAYAIDNKIDDGRPFSGGTVITNQAAYIYRVPGGSITSELYAFCNAENAGVVYPNAASLTTKNTYRSEDNIGIYSGSPVYRSCNLSVKAEF